jgi:Mg/Co/Ni transporter MgtE
MAMMSPSIRTSGPLATLGVLLPAAVHYARMDPTVASGPLVLMLGDIIAMTVYLGLATAWLV